VRSRSKGPRLIYLHEGMCLGVIRSDTFN